jgi:hypothetical protein
MKFLIFSLVNFSIVSAVTFNCTFQDTSIGSYTCYAILSNIDESDELTAVYGNHQAGKSNNDVDALWIENNQALTFMPRKMEIFFPNLTANFFYQTRIASLNGDELNPFPNYVYFGIRQNPTFERIPGELFANTRNLKRVWLLENNIKHVGEGLLDGLDLEWAYFQDNYCVNRNAANSVQLPALIEHLRNNCTDIEITTSTTEITTTVPETITTTTQEPSCGDLNEVVCHLQEQNEILMAQNEELEEKVKILDKKLDLVLEGILELSTRPCGV